MEHYNYPIQKKNFPIESGRSEEYLYMTPDNQMVWKTLGEVPESHVQSFNNKVASIRSVEEIYNDKLHLFPVWNGVLHFKSRNLFSRIGCSHIIDNFENKKTYHEHFKSYLLRENIDFEVDSERFLIKDFKSYMKKNMGNVFLYTRIIANPRIEHPRTMNEYINTFQKLKRKMIFLLRSRKNFENISIGGFLFYGHKELKNVVRVPIHEVFRLLSVPMNVTKDNVLGFVQKHFNPNVLVTTSDEVKKTCYKNHLRFVDLIRPYEDVCKTVYTSMSKEGGTIVVRDFAVKFCTFEDFQPIDDDLFQEYLHEVFQSVYDHDRDSQLMLSVNHATIIRPEICYTPWFERFRDEVLENTIRINEYETFKQPNTIILVASTNDPHPLKVYERLFSAKRPPSFFARNKVNPDIYCFYILLHDEESNNLTERNVRSLYVQLQKMYESTNCKLLRINSRLKEEREKKIRIERVPEVKGWDTCSFEMFKEKKRGGKRFEGYPDKGRGFYFTKKDLVSVRQTVEEFIKNGAIGNMRNITDMVLLRKKKRGGWRGLIGGFLGGGKQGANVGFDSREYLTRKLADFAFMLHNFRMANQQYNDVRSYFRKRGPGFRANISEMTALSKFFGEEVYHPEVEKGLKESVYSYLESRNMYMALRSSLFLSYIYRTRHEYLNCAECLIAVTNFLKEHPHLQALFFEQAAMCYMLVRKKPYRRKFCFFMYLASNRYFIAQYYQHSYRCIFSTYQLYHKKEWRKVFEDFSVRMARVTDKMGRIKQSISHFHEFFANLFSQEGREQHLYMQHFLKSAKSVLFGVVQDFEMELPEFNTNEDEMKVEISNDLNRTKGKENWKGLRQSLLEHSGKTKLDSRLERTVEVDEEISIEFSIRNRLSIPLRITAMNVIAKLQNPDQIEKKVSMDDIPEEGFPEEYLRKKKKWEDQQNAPPPQEITKDSKSDDGLLFSEEKKKVKEEVEEVEGEDNNNVGLLLNFDAVSDTKEEVQTKTKEEVLEKKKKNTSTSSSLNLFESISQHKFSCPTSQFTLDPLQEKRVTLKIIPHLVGVLEIKKIFWEVESLFSGTTTFDLIDKRLNTSRDERHGEFYEKSKFLTFNIIERVPKLEVKFHQFPTPPPHINALSTGEIKLGYLELKHTDTNVPIQNIMLESSHPSFFVFGECVKSKSADIPESKNTNSNNNSSIPKFPGVTEPIIFSKSTSASSNSDLMIERNAFVLKKECIGTVELFKKKGEEGNNNKAEEEEENEGEDDIIKSPEGEEINGNNNSSSSMLMPGETLIFPVFIRGGKSGTHRVNLLFYHEPSSNYKNLSSSRSFSYVPFVFQTSRFNMRVVESLSISPFTQPSLIHPRTFLLGITVANKTQKQEIFKLEQVVSCSKKWKIEKKEKVLSVLPNGYIGPNESITFYLNIKPCSGVPLLNDENDKEEDEPFLHTRVPLHTISNVCDTTQLPFSPFYFNDLYTNGKSGRILKEKGMSIMLVWSENDVNRFGQNSILFVDFAHRKDTVQLQHPILSQAVAGKVGEGKKWMEHKKSLSLAKRKLIDKKKMDVLMGTNFQFPSPVCPVQVLLHYDEKVVHNFFRDVKEEDTNISLGGNNNNNEDEEDEDELLLSNRGDQLQMKNNVANNICYVKVVFSIVNISLHSFAEVVLEVFPPRRMNKQSYIWMGISRIIFRNIKPGETVKVPVQVCFFDYGTYNLNQFRILWRIVEDINKKKKKVVVVESKKINYNTDEKKKERKQLPPRLKEILFENNVQYLIQIAKFEKQKKMEMEKKKVDEEETEGENVDVVVQEGEVFDFNEF